MEKSQFSIIFFKEDFEEAFPSFTVRKVLVDNKNDNPMYKYGLQGYFDPDNKVLTTSKTASFMFYYKKDEDSFFGKSYMILKFNGSPTEGWFFELKISKQEFRNINKFIEEFKNKIREESLLYFNKKISEAEHASDLVKSLS